MDSRGSGGPETSSLEQWLASLAQAPGPVVLLGGTGHLMLSAEEQQRVAREIERDVLPRFAGLPDDTDVIVATGLAPGADLVFTETVRTGLARLGRPCRPVGLLPVPVETLWQDWLERVGTGAGGLARTTRGRFDRARRDCERLVQLWDPRSPPDWSDTAARQHQYRRLGALLAAHSDVLVAVLRPDHAGAPGGTAEVVAWRRQRDAVPAALDPGPPRHRSGWSAGERLVVIDPAGAPSLLPQARAALRSGNYLLAYDLAAKTRRAGEFSAELEYVKLQALANAGSTQAALRRFQDLPASLRERDEDWLALAGRLHKDLGLRGGPGAAACFRRAAACYRTAYERTGGYFSAVNAATTALLGGDAGTARVLARETLARLAQAPARDDRDGYYRSATEAEAALLLGETPRARQALAHADGLLADDTNARSRTRRQLHRVCRALGADPRIVDALRLPPVVFLGADRPLAADEIPAGAFACAGITRPRELEAAERALALGARLHAVLAARPERMLAHWREAHGAAWEQRLGALIEAAHETSVALGFLESEDDWCDAYVGAMAVGLSRLAARRLDCDWRAVGVDSQATRDLVPGGAPQAVTAAGLRFERRFAGVIFADFAGFSRLPDAELPVFWAHFMRAIGARLAPLGPRLLLRRTWGDALHLVLTDALATAEAACAIQACLEELHPSLPGALADLELRLAAHYAPVFAGRDPVEDAGTYFGTQLSFTARIEPVTPPGMIFVTEAFAAQLALEAPDRFVLEYAGEIRLAKGYAQSRLFSLRP
jgi:hypothetical protein